MSLARREFIVLFLAGLAGAAALLPYQLALLTLPPGVPLSVVVAAGLVQSAILIAIAVAAGLWFARRAGLGAPVIEAVLRGEPVGPNVRARLGPAILLGVAASGIVLALDLFVFSPGLPAALRDAAARPPWWAGALASLYGGVTEELLTRLFLLSLFAWLFTRVSRDARAYWAAVSVSAALFGLGHLPATALLVPLTPLVVARALLLNGIPGLIFGWLYWRRGLEAAMIAHFSGDLVLHVLAPASLG